MRRFGILMSLLTMAVAPATVLAAGAGAIPSPLLLSIKRPGGNYSDAVDVKLGAGKTKEFKLKATNNSADSALVLQSVIDQAGYKIKYFRKGHNISAEVRNEGYSFMLEPGAHKGFTLTIKAPASSPDELCGYAGLYE